MIRKTVKKAINIKREFWGIHMGDDCPVCGLNTNLLKKKECVLKDGKKYCRNCFGCESNSKKQVIPYDFYEMRDSSLAGSNLNTHNESICNKLPRLEIAHLYGEYGNDRDMCLDFFYDGKDIYFRLYLVDDDSDFLGCYSSYSELYTYLSPGQAVEILNKNDIHILDGLTAENWREYFCFEKEF